MNRSHNLILSCAFIAKATPEDLMMLLNCMLLYHPYSLMVFNADTRLLAHVESVHINGNGIQLNIEGKE